MGGKADRDNRVAAEMVMGDEPVWDGSPVTKVAMMRALNWYSLRCKASDGQNYLVSWMKHNQYSKNDIRLAEGMNPEFLPSWLGWRARMYMQGLDKTDGREMFLTRLDEVLKLQSMKKDETVQKVKPKTRRPNVQDAIREKTHEILGQVEEFVDEIAEGNFKRKIDVDFYVWMKKNEIKQIYAPKIAAFYQNVVDELKEVSTDKQLKEAYSGWSARQLKNQLAFFEMIVADATRFSEAKRKQRKPRRRKAKTKAQLLTKFKYCKESTDYKVASVAPEKIIGASEIWVFHTEKRWVGVYKAAAKEGLSIKGTTLQNVGESASKTLRKPEQILPKFVKGKKRANKNQFAAIRAKAKNPTTRINDKVVILTAL